MRSGVLRHRGRALRDRAPARGVLMSLARAHGVVISGVDAHLVEVEAHLSSGLPGMSIVGLADTAVGEARDRVRAAVLNSGARWPQVRITVGLSPASLHKRGSGLDLAIASAILAADGQIPAEPPRGRDPLRRARARRAGPPGARCGRGRGCGRAGGSEPDRRGAAQRRRGRGGPGDRRRGGRVPAALGPAGDRGHGATSPTREESPAEREVPVAGPAAPEPDLADVLGQPEAVAALEVAAVGGHHVAMVGRPGVGKTLLAERLPTILPDLADDDALTVTAIRSVVADVHGLVRRPPFQSPHHTATVAALVGGGRGGQPTPGAVTLAHAGVLFLDEAAEFGSACLESLRQPLESGVVVHRAGRVHRADARAVPAGPGGQPMPVRPGRRGRPGVHLQVGGPPSLPGEAVGAADGPRGHPRGARAARAAAPGPRRRAAGLRRPCVTGSPWRGSGRSAGVLRSVWPQPSTVPSRPRCCAVRWPPIPPPPTSWAQPSPPAG